MRLVRTPEEARALRSGLGRLGLVPTMGALHEGHLSLARRARAECEACAVSIFVNPLQFAPGGDFERYPRDLERDAALLEREGVDFVFAPEAGTLYPEGFDARVEIGGVSRGLEGAARPGHFAGVATVLVKLFNILRPDRAYFGKKDAQQLAVVRKLVRDLDIPVEIVGAETVREPDGLALSSRNAYLTAAERAAAPAIHRALCEGRRRVLAGETRAREVRAAVLEALAGEPALEPEYVAVSDPETLEDLVTLGARGALLSTAVRLGTARLIDNLDLPPPGARKP